MKELNYILLSSAYPGPACQRSILSSMPMPWHMNYDMAAIG